jgi:hypothetical protein
MAPEQQPPERVSSEIAETISREPAPHDPCDRLGEVIIPDRRHGVHALPDATRCQTEIDCVLTLACRLT